MDSRLIARLLIGGVIALCPSLSCVPAHAQGPAQGKPAAVLSASPVPDPYKLNMLIRTTLIALSQANLSGNYTVLRDLGSPSFQSSNTAARLTEAFTDLRRRRLDFSPILFFDPKLVRQPSFDERGRLRLTGFIETRPEQIDFDMLFEDVGGDWRLFGLAVKMQPAPPPAAESSQSPKPAARAAKPKEAMKTSAPARN